MDRAQGNLLKSSVTRCRRLLEESIFEALEGRFGIHQGGAIEDAEHMSHLALEDRSYRGEIIACIEHAEAAGFDPRAAVEQVVREAAFTHLNRLCAYKMLEDRSVIREAVGRGPNSNGFKFYLAEHPDDEMAWREGRQDTAYRHFLRWLASTLEGEAGPLFSRNDPANRLFPSHRVLTEVLEIINEPGLAGIWSEDETIGWIYQYFTPKELRDEARKASSAPRNSYELAFRNQFYTPRYVVRYLVDNTLGRTWYEMRGGITRLIDLCSFLLRACDDVPRSRGKKDPRDIRIIDPAGGSGHFLLYCFELLEVIYEEAYDDETAPASKVTGGTLRKDYPDFEEFKRRVPSMILEHNLHGIDIDLRSTQIAALALWMRAQKAYREMGLVRERRPEVGRANIVCAEPMPGEGELLEEFVSGLEPRLLGQLVKETFDEMRLAGEAGSLLRIEEAIRGAISKAKRQWLSRPKVEQLLLLPKEKRVFAEQLGLFDVSDISDDSFWKDAEQRLVNALKAYADRVANGKGFTRRLFADDTVQGLSFVDISRGQFDVVLMNPPFGAPSVGSKGYIVKEYPNSGHDLACAFVDRWLAKCGPGGRLGAITTRTPFFLSSSTKWREQVILKDGALETFADLGYGVLDAMVETAAYTLSRDGSNTPATFIRALRDEDKASALGEAAQNPKDSRRFVVAPESFSQVPNSPLCYWVSDRVRRLFVDLPPFEGDGRTARVGLQTSDDFRFVRLWWEVPRENEARSKEETLAGKRWVPFAKGGAYSPYYADLHLVVNWEKDGEEIRNFVDPISGRTYSRPQNTDFYFRPGLTWPLRTQFGFNMRACPAGCVFGHKGPTAFLHCDTLDRALALTNTLAFQRLLSLQMAFGSFEVGVIQRTPIPDRLPSSLGLLATRVLNIKRTADTIDETTRLFILPALLQAKGFTLAQRLNEWQQDTQRVEMELAEKQRQTDEIAFDLYGFSREDREAIALDLGRSSESDAGEDTDEDKEAEDGIEPAQDESAALVKSLLSWCVGVVFGRFDVRLATGERPIPELGDPFDPLPIYSPGMLPGGIGPEGYPIEGDRDGILVDDEDHNDDVVRKVREVLHLLWKDRAEAIEREACAFLGIQDLRDYFRRSGKGGFFDDYIKRYSKSRRKAPIYVLLQSARRNYGIWLYYPRLDSDILFKATETYVRPRILRQENLIADMRARRAGLAGAEIRRLEKEIERQENLLAEIADFKERLERAAIFYVHPDRFEPDLNDGVVLNIAPLWELIPWSEAKKYWEELNKGKYEWSSISRHIRKRQ